MKFGNCRPFQFQKFAETASIFFFLFRVFCVVLNFFFLLFHKKVKKHNTKKKKKLLKKRQIKTWISIPLRNTFMCRHIEIEMQEMSYRYSLQ